MIFKNLQSLEEAKRHFETIENQDCGIRTPYFKSDVYVYCGLCIKMLEFPKEPIDTIFNRVIINNPPSSDYFSVMLEPQQKISKKLFKQRSSLGKNGLNIYSNDAETDFYVNEKLNYDSDFNSVKDPIEFLSKWFYTVFSDDIIVRFLNGKSFREVLNNYKNNFGFQKKDPWGNLDKVLRITEERNDLRIVVIINPFDLHPEISFTALEKKGIVTPMMSLIYDWFRLSNLMKLINKVDISFDEETRYKRFPTVSNNEQHFSICSTPTDVNGLNRDEIIIKGSKRQMKFYKNYFKELLELYPTDALGKADFEEDEFHPLDLFGDNLKCIQGYRIYYKPEFDLIIHLYPAVRKDDNGVEFLKFYFNIKYRPHIKSRKDKLPWTWHHVLEDLGK